MDFFQRQILGKPIQDILRYLLFLAVISLSLAIAWIYLSRDIFFDDAFMFIRYAENLLRHGVFGWNAEEAAYGCTSVGYVFSTAFFIKTGLLNLMTQAKFLQAQSLFYLVLALFFLYKSSLLILGNEKNYKQEMSLLFMLLLLLNPLLRRNITGMDATMALFANSLLVFAAFSYHRKAKDTYLYFLIFAAYLSFFVRPDNGLYATIFPFLFLWVFGKNRRDLLVFSLGLGVILLVDSLSKYLYFGAILPIPFYVKTPGFYEAYLGIDLWNTWHYLAEFILYSSPFIFLGILLYKKDYLKKILPFLIPLILTQAYHLQAVAVMGYDARLLLPSLPYLVAIALIILDSYEGILSFKQPKLLVRAALAVSCIGLSYVGLLSGGAAVYEHKKGQALKAAEKFDMGLPERASHDSLAWNSIVHLSEMVQEIGDEHFVLAASEHGYLSAQNPDTKILCLIGLHNTLSLSGKALDQEGMELSLQRYKPDLIWMYQYNYPSLTYALMRSPSFQENYDYYHDLLDLGLAIRKDSPYAEKIRDYLNRIYPD